MKDDVIKAIDEMKRGKAVGTDGIPAEMLKELGSIAISEIVGLCNLIYNKGVWPKDFLKTLMIPLAKKKKAIKCEDYRTISLISHTAKVLLRILTRRLYGKLDYYIGEEQYGFQKGRGSRDAIGVVRTIGERYIEKGKGICICFVDLDKAFDRDTWDKLLAILKN